MKSKLAVKEYILEQNSPSNKRAYILSICIIYRPGNKGNLNLLYSFVSKGVPNPFGAYQNERSFVSVDSSCFTIK